MSKQQIAGLKENRRHGTLIFPCAFYIADSRMTPQQNFCVKHHWQEEFEIIYFEKGRYHVEINMVPYEIERECLCFIGSGELHYIYAVPEYREQALVFSPSIISFGSPDAAEEQLIRPFISRQLSCQTILYPENPAFPELLDRFNEIRKCFTGKTGSFKETYNTDDASSELRIKASLLTMLAALSEKALLHPTAQIYDSRVEAMKKVLTYIRDHYTEKIFLSELAEIMNMNEQYFCRFFKKAVGKSPVAYINEYRTARAVQLLKNSEMPVAEIALACGYNNLGHFTKEFKKSENETPLRLRKKYHEDLKNAEAEAEKKSSLT